MQLTNVPYQYINFFSDHSLSPAIAIPRKFQMNFFGQLFHHDDAELLQY